MSEYLQLCHKAKPGVDYSGWLVSEKLDGQRAWWDGGISRGYRKNTIPWANCLKDNRYTSPQIATGLWSRLGNVIHAPTWWLDQLPNVMLDGELWCGYGHRQHLMTAIKGNSPSFKDVRYMVYDAPPAQTMLSGRKCSVGSGRKLEIPWSGTWSAGLLSPASGAGFVERLEFAQSQIKSLPVVTLHQQHTSTPIDELLVAVLARGGEGLVLGHPKAIYTTERSHNRLKLKPFDDAEGTVIGWTSGAETDKGSRLVGKLGSLRLRLANGRLLDLSGFTDEERVLPPGLAILAASHPGTYFDAALPTFGSVVSFKYRGLTADGIPMEARYWRKREDE